MYPNNKGVRCYCGARISAYKCAICGEYFYMCSYMAEDFPGGEENLDCSCGGEGQHCPGE
jgi:hypothetical protein